MKNYQHVFVAVTLTVLTLPASARQSFQGLGDLPGGTFSSGATGVSNDGLVVVGFGIGASGIEAFRWTSGGGMVGLGDLAGGSFYSTASGVSSDGSVVVGASTNTSGNEAFRWTDAGGMVGLGELAGGGYYSFGEAVSADGSVVVGASVGAAGEEAFRWTSEGGMVGLGDLAGGLFQSDALGVSSNGAVVVGRSTPLISEAFHWTNGGGMVGLGGNPSIANAVSDNSLVVVGKAGNEAFRWTNTGGMISLGDFAGGSFRSEAYGVSPDGSIVVGLGTGVLDSEAFVWDAVNGMRSLKEILIGLGIDLSGWQLIVAYGVSADGNTIVGYGTNPDGFSEAYIAVISDSLACHADINSDTNVNVTDLLALLAAWGACP